MRPIKFRAWDDHRKQMVYDGWAVKFKPERDIVSGIMLEPDETPNTERIYGEWNDSDSIILMQFAGLHDKNGAAKLFGTRIYVVLQSKEILASGWVHTHFTKSSATSTRTRSS